MKKLKVSNRVVLENGAKGSTFGLKNGGNDFYDCRHVQDERNEGQEGERDPQQRERGQPDLGQCWSRQAEKSRKGRSL